MNHEHRHEELARRLVLGKLKTDGKVQFRATNDRGKFTVTDIEPAP